MTELIPTKNVVLDGSLQKGFIQFNEEYKKKWKIYGSEDYFHLLKNGTVINNNAIYRVGGMGAKLNEKYFLLLKYTEAFYEDSITKDKNKKRHLEGVWTILDNNGNEKVSFNLFSSPYLVSNSCLYLINSKYYNIETGEYYGDSSKTMETKEFLFLERSGWNSKKDGLEAGVLKIRKEDGKILEFIPKD